MTAPWTTNIKKICLSRGNHGVAETVAETTASAVVAVVDRCDDDRARRPLPVARWRSLGRPLLVDVIPPPPRRR